MRLARVTLIWAALAAAICVPIAAAAASPLLAWRGPVYILAGFRRDYRTGAHARSAFADCRLLAGTVGLSWKTRTSLDRRRAGRDGGGPRRGPLDHQPAGHD